MNIRLILLLCEIMRTVKPSLIIQLTNNNIHRYTANSIKVDIDNSQMCNMTDRVPKEYDDSLHANVKNIL